MLSTYQKPASFHTPGGSRLAPRDPGRQVGLSPRQILQQQIQRRARERLHVGEPVGAAGLQRDHLLLAGPRPPCSYGRRRRRSGCRSVRWRRSPTGPSRWRSAAGSGSPAIWRRARRPSGCPSSPHRECPSGSAARRGYRPRRRRGNRRTRRAPRAARPRSARRSRIPRPRWSVAARSVWRRSARRSQRGLSCHLNSGAGFVSATASSRLRLVGERVIDHADEILGSQARSAPISHRDRRTVLPRPRRPRSCPP